MLCYCFEYIAKTRKEAKSLGARFYYTGKPCKRGHWSKRLKAGVCCECTKNYDSRDKAKNPNRRIELSKIKSQRQKERYHSDEEYRRKRIDERMAWHKKKMDTDPEYAEKIRQEAREQGKRRWEKIGSAEKACHQWARWREKLKAEEPEKWKAIQCCRNWITRCIKNGHSKTKSTQTELGYTYSEFIEDIESKMRPGMTWGNHGEWHIDHIKPVSAFVNDGITDPSIINALSNMQPLWAEENMAKGDKWP